MADRILLITALAGVLAILVMKLISKEKHPLRGAALSLLTGPAVLAGVNLLCPLTGVWLPVSRLSVTASALLGVPGVVLFLLIQAFF